MQANFNIIQQFKDRIATVDNKLLTPISTTTNYNMEAIDDELFSPRVNNK